MLKSKIFFKSNHLKINRIDVIYRYYAGNKFQNNDKIYKFNVKLKIFNL